MGLPGSAWGIQDMVKQFHTVQSALDPPGTTVTFVGFLGVRLFAVEDASSSVLPLKKGSASRYSSASDTLNCAPVITDWLKNGGGGGDFESFNSAP